MGSFFVDQHYSVTTILQVVTPISVLKNVILGSSLQYRFSKITPSFFTIKEGFFLPLRLSCKESSTFLTKPLFPQEREDVTALRCCFSKIIPSFFTIKEGSTSHLGLLPSGKKRKTALRCSEPLRYKVGGASKPSPWLCGMGPPGDSMLIGTARLMFRFQHKHINSIVEFLHVIYKMRIIFS